MDREDRAGASGAQGSWGLSIVVPTLNEATGIGDFLGRLGESLIHWSPPVEVIVVDDHSEDGTAEIVRRSREEYPLAIQIIEHRGARSLAGSVVEGARAATFGVVCVLDADLSHDPQDVPRIAGPVMEGRWDVAVGSRYHAEGRIGGWPLWRRLSSRWGTRLARSMSRIEDPLSGFFATRRELLAGEVVALRPRGFKILLELLGKAPWLRVGEVPIRFRDREKGQSKFGVRQAAQFLQQMATMLLTQKLGRKSRVPLRPV